jgi:hypothetical protein
MIRIRLERPFLISAAAILVAAIVVAVQLPALSQAIFSHGLQEDPVQARVAGHLKGHKDDHLKYVQRFNGRSLFNKPLPPRTTQVATAPRAIEKTEPVKVETGPPPSYGGPAVMFVLGNEVWFRNGLTLSVGEEGQGVKVIAADPPWKVTLGHSGGQYDIELFKKIDLFKDNKPRAQRDFPGLKPAPQGAAIPAGRSEASP